MSPRLHLLSLTALAAPLAFFCAQGAVEDVEYSRRGAAVWMLALLVAAALHCVWIGLVRRGAGTLAAAGCWLVCAVLAGTGLRAWQLPAPGWLAEGLLGSVACAGAGAGGFADRLARWRDARAAIAAQLEMAEGVVPWLRRCLGQAWSGMARSPIEAAHLTVQAALRQSVRAAACRAAETIQEEEARQLALTALESVGRQASLTFARAALDCERHALSAATQVRSAIAQTSLAAPVRERLAQACEALLLSLTLPADYMPAAGRKEEGADEERSQPFAGPLAGRVADDAR